MNDNTTVTRQELEEGLENIRKALNRCFCSFSKKTRRRMKSVINQVEILLGKRGEVSVFIESGQLESLGKTFEKCKAEANRTSW